MATNAKADELAKRVTRDQENAEIAVAAAISESGKSAQSLAPVGGSGITEYDKARLGYEDARDASLAAITEIAVRCDG